MSYPYKIHSKAVKHTQNIGMWTFIVLTVICVVIIFFAFMIWATTSSTVSSGNKYYSHDYQEFLIDNPGYKLKVNNKELTKYKRPELKMPLVVELTTGGKDVYEVFVKKKDDWVSIIPKQLYVHAKGG